MCLQHLLSLQNVWYWKHPRLSFSSVVQLHPCEAMIALEQDACRSSDQGFGAVLRPASETFIRMSFETPLDAQGVSQHWQSSNRIVS